MATKEEILSGVKPELQIIGGEPKLPEPVTAYNEEIPEKPQMPKLRIQFVGQKKDLNTEGTVTVHGEMIQIQQYEFFLPESEFELPQWRGRVTNRWYYPSTAIKEIHVDTRHH